MSQENVEVLRAFFAAWNAGDMDAIRELLHPSVIMHAPTGWPEPGPEVGRDAVMRQFHRLRDAWDADSVEPIGDFIDAGDRVVMLAELPVRAQASGIPLAGLIATVSVLHEGKATSVHTYLDHAEALEAVGLREKSRRWRCQSESSRTRR